MNCCICVESFGSCYIHDVQLGCDSGTQLYAEEASDMNSCHGPQNAGHYDFLLS